MLIQNEEGFTILEPLGKGGYGVVYKALDPQTARTVALKVFEHKNADAFCAEGALGRLDHPNLRRVWRRINYGSRLALVMEFVEGESLYSLITRLRAKGRTLPLHATSFILTEMCKGLEHLATHGDLYGHGDLKPDNVLIGRDGTVKLIDVNAMHLVQERRRRTIQESNEVLISPRYCSPEQAEGHLPTPQSDVFNLGLILYKMVTTEGVLSGITVLQDALNRSRVGPSPMHHERMRQASPRLEDVFARATALDPANRHHGAGAFAEALTSAHPPSKQCLLEAL